MSENYIKNHFGDIKKYASVIERRLNDDDYMLESALKENKLILEQLKKHNKNYVFIDEEYNVDACFFSNIASV
mgnify:CR=1 FL=1